MALFDISGCIDTGSCSQPQRPFTHQSKKLLCFCSPSPHQSVLSATLCPHPLCFFSYFFIFWAYPPPQNTVLPWFSPSSVQSLSHFHTCPLYPFPSHSLFLQVFNVLLPCLHLHGHPLNPSQLRFSFSPLLNNGTESRIQVYSKLNSMLSDCCWRRFCAHLPNYWLQVCLF